MSVEPFIGEVAIFAGNFAPRGWAFCEGQLIAIPQNFALFSILGTMYGGNGTTTFALPDLRGRAPIGGGTGPGLTPRVVGESGGVQDVTLTETQMPRHLHPASTLPANTNRPVGAVPAVGGRYAEGTPAFSAAPHDNRPPSMPLRFIIALEGIFPSRS